MQGVTMMLMTLLTAANPTQNQKDHCGARNAPRVVTRQRADRHANAAPLEHIQVRRDRCHV